MTHPDVIDQIVYLKCELEKANQQQRDSARKVAEISAQLSTVMTERGKTPSEISRDDLLRTRSRFNDIARDSHEIIEGMEKDLKTARSVQASALGEIADLDAALHPRSCQND